MIIDFIGCLHGNYPTLPGGDLLIITGDLTKRDELKEYRDFNYWLSKQFYRKKIVIGGNHDHHLEKDISTNLHSLQEDILVPTIWMSATYLQDRAIEFEGLKIWGSPHSLWFKEINPKCTAFTGTEEQISKYYERIPEDVDMIISHTPFYGILDQNYAGTQCGSVKLREVVERVRPKYFICSHIHEQGGKTVYYKHDDKTTRCLNCSMVDVNYYPKTDIMRIEH